ncbi:MAG: DUF4174 domain-containing protein [Pseudomonadota bacterium]
MENYLWKSRPLIVFAPSASHPKLNKQRQIVSAAQTGMKERDMVVIYVVGASTTASFGSPPSSSADALRKRYRVARRTFRSILVGKDGGTKKASSKPLGPRQLFQVIDAMPMRQQEMKSR